MDVTEFADAVVRYCQRVRGSVTSWIRTPARNAMVGGVRRSAHLYALGADVVPEAPLSADERRRVGAALGLRVIVEGDHDHLQPADWPATDRVTLWDNTSEET